MVSISPREAQVHAAPSSRARKGKVPKKRLPLPRKPPKVIPPDTVYKRRPKHRGKEE